MTLALTGDMVDEKRYGVKRESMRTNVLLQKHQVGKTPPTAVGSQSRGGPAYLKQLDASVALADNLGLGAENVVKKMTFVECSDGHVFGSPSALDHEGVMELISSWKEHRICETDPAGPDFMSMNRLSAKAGLTKSSEQREYRVQHLVTTKRNQASKRWQVKLPSDKDPSFVYGKPASFRNAEDKRHEGPETPPMKCLIQNAYGSEWCKQNAAREHLLDRKWQNIAPAATQASKGHSFGAEMRRRRLASEQAAAPEQTPGFKMKKFAKVKARVKQSVVHKARDGAAEQQAGLKPANVTAPGSDMSPEEGKGTREVLEEAPGEGPPLAE